MHSHHDTRKPRGQGIFTQKRFAGIPRHSWFQAPRPFIFCSKEHGIGSRMRSKNYRREFWFSALNALHLERYPTKTNSFISNARVKPFSMYAFVLRHPASSRLGLYIRPTHVLENHVKSRGETKNRTVRQPFLKFLGAKPTQTNDRAGRLAQRRYSAQK